MDTQRKKIFISHNSGWEFILDFAGLIYELGYYPVVVENEPNLGLDPGAKSKHYMYLCDLIVFVITRDAVDSDGRPHPKSNVAMEIGLAQEKFKPEQRIFWVEKDARPPSMVTETYISLQDGNYYKGIAHLIRNIKKAIPNALPEDKQTVSLDDHEKFVIYMLSTQPHGSLARPPLLEVMSKKLGIDEREFNLIRFSLKEKRLITEGQTGIGHKYSGHIYLQLTRLGWEVASTL
jgi:hypothetical protein